MSFMNELSKNISKNYNTSITENGAVGYKTTGSDLVDINFKVPSYRDASDATIIKDFEKAFYADGLSAVKWLFYARDAREGLGERKLFRVIFKHLATIEPDMTRKLLPLLAEYGRYDDMFVLLDTALKVDVIKLVVTQLPTDVSNMVNSRNVSLLAKWMPSENTSSQETRKLARMFIKELNMTPARYRKMLTSLRKYIDVVEVKMSAKNWAEIDYAAVPSKANVIYNDAFLRNDETRRRAFLEKAKSGEVTMNAGVLYPHDIVHKYAAERYRSADDALEVLWKNLPNLVKDDDSTIVVADGSGSMIPPVSSKSSVTALEVANAFAIYFAERCSGDFKNKYITFSSRPQMVSLTNKTLFGNLKIAYQHDECSNTNIEKVFELILDTAVKGRMNQSDMPKNILIISDMEFDYATSTGWYGNSSTVNASLFKTISDKFAAAGYALPRLVFWNINSRTNTIPVIENELGVVLVSGFSTNIVKMVMSNETDPLKALLSIINSPRYVAIEAALK